VNDYLAERDSAQMAPVFERLGLSVGCVRQGQPPAERRAAYACDIAYCSNKEVAFDYLRDRLVLGGKPHPISMRLGAINGEDTSGRLLLRGLQFAIVDEADSVLVDEARTPLILSGMSGESAEEVLHRSALQLAQEFDTADYSLGEDGVKITGVGLAKLERIAKPLGRVWNGPRRREQLVRQALTALHVLQRDKHYLVRDGKVVIVDEYTGRLMPDRSWEQGLHQLIEIKERCEVTAQRDTLARISYQRFFRRYVHLSGMTGTAAEVAGELRAVYRLRVSRVPTNRPVCRHRVARRGAHRSAAVRPLWPARRPRQPSGEPCGRGRSGEIVPAPRAPRALGLRSPAWLARGAGVWAGAVARGTHAFAHAARPSRPRRLPRRHSRLLRRRRVERRASLQVAFKSRPPGGLDGGFAFGGRAGSASMSRRTSRM